MIELNNNYYIESSNIRVFPCAYRGYYEETNGGNIIALVFDPEARATTESNFTETFHKLSNKKDSYVVEWKPESITSDKGTLKCVIGGYYFEIYNQSIKNFFTPDGEPYYLSIKVTSSNLSAADKDGPRKTNVLTSFIETTTYLDVKNNGAKYIFTGLMISKTPPEGTTASLKPFIAVYDFTKAGTIRAGSRYNESYYFDSTEKQYKKLPNTEIKTGDALIGKDYYTRTIDQHKVDPCQLPITSLLDIGQGEYSIRLFEDSTTTGTNNTEATGDYSVALGKSTKATGEASAAFGDQSEALEKGAFVAGIGTKASGEGAVAFGKESQATGKGAFAAGNSGTKASAEGAVAIGNKAIASAKGAIALGNTTTAKAESAIALGNTTTASEEGAVALGNTTAASAKGAFAVGNNTEASGIGAIALGNYTKAVSNGAVALGTNVTAGKVVTIEEEGEDPVTEILARNQVVIGQYNAEDTEQAFIIANGSSTAGSNKFTVSYYGDVKALGNLEVNGNRGNNPAIASTGAGRNDLVLGTTTDESSGSITVHGAGENETAFSVNNSGTTTIKGDTTIESETEFTDTESGIEGALIVKGGVGIAKNLNVGGTLNITGETTLNSTLNVTGETTLNSTLDVTGKTTLTDALEVTKSTTLKNTLKVKKSTTLEDALNVTGATTLNGEFIVSDGSVTPLEVQLPTDANNRGLVTIGHELNVGGITTLTSNCVINSDTASTSTESGALTINGGLGVKGAIYANNIVTTQGITNNGGVTIADTTNSDDLNTGALQVRGGVAITKALTVGEQIKVINSSGTSALTLGSADNKVGSLSVYGPAGTTALSVQSSGAVILGQEDNTIELKGKTTINKESEASSTDGALVVNGGLNVGKGLYIKSGTLTVAGGGGSFTGDVTVGDITISKDKASISGIVDFNAKTITATSKIEAAYFNATSDARLKHSIKDYKFEKSILDLPIKSFIYINDPAQATRIGCLAQDLQEICPELVTENPDGMLSIQETKLIYALLQEVKELKEKVELLERR
jgi:hypothetical protein